MNHRNYQKELDTILEDLKTQEKVPKLLLHSCCAPCSSYVLEYLSQYFEIMVYYYNPNIYPLKEYEKRVKEQQKLISDMKFLHPVLFQTGPYEPDAFFNVARGFEKTPEGGERCFRCFELRLCKAAKAAVASHCDYFTTTLTISPLKNADKLNQIGETLAQEYRLSYLSSDFKKKDGYKRSLQLSKEYGLYRQDYCGCLYSVEARERER